MYSLCLLALLLLFQHRDSATELQGTVSSSRQPFLSNFPLLKMTQCKELTLLSEALPPEPLNRPHKGGGFPDNRHVGKIPGKGLLPSSFPSAPHTAGCQAQELHLRGEPCS